MKKLRHNYHLLPRVRAPRKHAFIRARILTVPAFLQTQKGCKDEPAEQPNDSHNKIQRTNRREQNRADSHHEKLGRDQKRRYCVWYTTVPPGTSHSRAGRILLLTFVQICTKKKQPTSFLTTFCTLQSIAYCSLRMAQPYLVRRPHAAYWRREKLALDLVFPGCPFS